MQIDLKENEFDIPQIIETLQKDKIKLIHIQRSKGYSTRKSLTIDNVEQVIKEIRKADKEAIIFIDNCYCEFVERKTPLEVGADIIVRITHKKSRWRNCTKWSLCSRKERICITYLRKTNSTWTWKRSRTKPSEQIEDFYRGYLWHQV